MLAHSMYTRMDMTHTQFYSYHCVYVRYRGKVSTEPLPRNDKRIFTEPSRYLETIEGYTYRHTD
jgi:hypothetical protein